MTAPDALAARVAVAALTDIDLPARRAGYVLIAVADTDEQPRVVTDLPPGHALVVLTGAAATLAMDAIEEATS